MALAIRQAPWLTQSTGQTTASQTVDHLLDALEVVFDTAIVVEECRHARLGGRAQVGHDGGAPANVENALAGRRRCFLSGGHNAGKGACR